MLAFHSKPTRQFSPCGELADPVTDTNDLRMQTLRNSELVAAGYSPAMTRSQVANGRWQRLRRGGYLLDPDPMSAEEQHLQLMAVTMRMIRQDAVVSHASAGLLWELPVDRMLLIQVHVTRPTPTGASRTSALHIHSGRLDASLITDRHGYRVTSLERTAVDLARQSQPERALAVLDAALRAGADPQMLQARMREAKGSPGVVAARWALDRANPLAESVGESISRYLILQAGLPEPVLQYEVRDELGILLGRADFAWPEQRVLGEFDGRVKYDELVAEGGSAADVVMAEKRRENLFLADGWWVIRWAWADLRLGAFLPGLRNALRVRTGR